MTWKEKLNDLERKTERGKWWVRLDRVREIINQTREDAVREYLENLYVEITQKKANERKIAEFGEYQAETYEDKMFEK